MGTKEEKRAALQAERDDQVFYRTLQLDLAKVGPPDSASPSTSTTVGRPEREQTKTRRSGRPRSSRPERSSRKDGRSTRTQRNSQRGGQQQKEVVQNFFRHLLHQGGSGPSERGPSSSSRSSRSQR